MTETPSIFRTYKQGAFKLYESTWGKYLAPTIDPDANVVEFTEEHFKMFELNEEIHQIPSNLWSAWIDLCFHYADKVNKNVEVSMRILRSEDDPSVYKFIVPFQEVGGASVRVNDFQKSVDLISGEELTSYPPVGWIPVGSSHSHNTMSAFFSGTDDKFELSDPGLHIVVGSIDHQKQEYQLSISVTANNRRFIIDANDESKIVDFTPDDDSTYHSKVLDYVTIPPVKIQSVFTGTAQKKDYKSNFIGNFSKETLNNLKEDSSEFDPWKGNFTPITPDVQEIESAILEYVDQHEYEVDKLNRILSVLQDCQDTVAYQLDEIKKTFESILN